MSSRNLEDIEPGEQWFRLQILKHFKIGAEDKSFICPRTIGKKCPICEHRQQLMNAGRGTDDPEVRALVAKKRDLYNVIDLADDAEKVKVWEISYHNFGKRLLEEIREADDDSVAAQFADIDNGAIITVRMVEETMGSTKFLSASRIDFTEREEMLDESILGQVVQFDKALVVHSYEKLAKIFYDQEDLDSDEDDSVDEEEDAASSSRRPKIKKIEPAKRPEPDEEDDDEEEEEEEEKPVPQKKPAKKQVKKPVKQPEPDEEDEEEDDDDEEDEKPIPQKKPVKKPVKQPEPEDDDDEEDEEDEEEEEKPVKKPAKKPEKKPTRPKRPEPEDEEDDEEDEEEEEKPVPQKKPVKKPKKPASDECPHGGEFGTDCDSEEMYAHCEQCDIWSECRDAADALLATQVKKPKTKK